MTIDFASHLSHLQREHATAIRLLTAINEGEDGVMPEIHAFLKLVKDRCAAEAMTKAGQEARHEKRKSGGRKASGLFEIAPRVEGGTDFGADGLVLARKDNLRLVWRSGSKFWADMMTGYVYTPGELLIMAVPQGRTRPETQNLTDNHRSPNTPDTRLTRKLLERHAAAIDGAFGAGTAAAVAGLKQTIVLQAAAVGSS